MYKLNHRQLPSVFFLLFQCNHQVHNIATRNSNSYYFPYFSKSITQQSIFFSGVETWNLIPSTVRKAQNIASFNISLKKMLLTKTDSQSVKSF